MYLYKQGAYTSGDMIAIALHSELEPCAVRGAHSQLWGTIIPVCFLYAARKYDRRFGTHGIV